ncbi:M4 family metallopeptidase, partial [Ruminiclostridium papyrosolvens]
MKSAKRILSTVLLSVSLIASSFPSVYANNENADNNAKIGAIQAKEVIPSFLSGDLTQESEKTPQQIVEQYIAQEAKKYQLPAVQFKVTEQFVNSLNRTVVKTIQTYNGVPVQNSDRNYFINTDGVIEYIVGDYVYDITDRLALAVKPAEVSQKSIVSVIEEDLGIKPVYNEAPKSQLLLYPVDGKYNYIYKVTIEFRNPTYNKYVYYIDASNMSILGKNNQELSLEEPTVGSGIGQSGAVKQPLKMVKDNDVYYLKNTVENLKTIYELDGTYSEQDNCFDTDTGTNYQKDAVDAHYNMTNIINFFKGSPFYRNGNDDNGSEYTVEIIKDSSNVLNAYGYVNKVRIGAGKGSAGKSVSYAVDAMAHEFTHGILTSEGLGDFDEGHFEFNPPLTERMSLHEGISDVFGTICEYFLENEGTPDWTIGEDTGTIFRDCANPVIDNYTEYKRRILECENDRTIKYPKPHEGGGVITKAANLMAMGGTFKNVTVAPIGMEKLAVIFYHAVNDGNMVYDMKYPQFAAALLQSAETIYGANSSETNTVRKALGAVGLDLRMVYASGPSLQLTWLPLAGSHYGIYRRETGSTAEPEKIQETYNTTETVQAISWSYDYFIASIDENGNRISEFGSPLTYKMS